MVSSPLFAWVDVLIRVFSSPDPSLAKKCRVLALNFERFWARFWNVLGSILEVSGDYLSAFRCPFSSQSSN